MAILNSIGSALGMGTAHTSSTSAAGINAVSLPYANQTGNIYMAGASAQSVWTSQSEIDSKLRTMQQYAELVGDEIEYVRWKPNMKTEDAKISILKITPVGDVIKNVGMRVDENSYYIYREKGE